MSPTAVKILAVYAAGFVAFPFAFSLIDGWPLVKPRISGEDALFSSLLAVAWPVCAVAWLVGTWWVAASWLGVKARDAVFRLFRRGRAK